MGTLGDAPTFNFFTHFNEFQDNREYAAILFTCEHAVTFYSCSSLRTPKTARCITSIGYAAIPSGPKKVKAMPPPPPLFFFCCRFGAPRDSAGYVAKVPTYTSLVRSGYSHFGFHHATNSP